MTVEQRFIAFDGKEFKNESEFFDYYLKDIKNGF